MKKWILWFLAAGVSLFVINTLYDAGVFKSISNRVQGELTLRFRLPGPEDMLIIGDQNLLIISSTDRRSVMAGKPGIDGLFAVPLGHPDAIPRRLPHTYNGEFHPHGISCIQSAGKTFLFAVNHNPSGNFVEVFQLRNDSLLHLKTYSDPLMCCPNDVVAIAPDQFYVTNDHGTEGGFGKMMEDYLRIPWSTVAYFDGSSFRKVRDGLNYGNGITVSNDHQYVYVAATTSREILTFRRREDGSLSLSDKVTLPSGPDNIDVDASGNLWVGCHPKLLAFVAHAGDSTRYSPSQVLQLTPDGKGSFDIAEIFMDDGKILSGCSVATRWENLLFVGGVFDRKILEIKLAQ